MIKDIESLTLEITTFCQANCIVCVRDKLNFKLSNMPQNLFEKAVAEAVEYSKKLKFINLGGMGEPLLDPQIDKKLTWLDRTFPDIEVGVTTNGQLLMQKKDILCKYVDILKISNYGFTKKSFETVHGGSLIFEDVKANIEKFLQIPRDNRPKTIMSFLVLDENRGEEMAWKDYWEDKCEELFIWLPHNWAGYGKSHTNQNPEKCRSCGRPGNDFVVRANGDVSACCWDFNRELTIGNVNNLSFKQICESQKLKKIMQMHKERKFFESDNICRYCDQLYDRSDALIYSSNEQFKINSKTLKSSL